MFLRYQCRGKIMSRSACQRLLQSQSCLQFFSLCLKCGSPFCNLKADHYGVCPLRPLISLRVYSGLSDCRKLMTLWRESRRRNPSARPKISVINRCFARTFSPLNIGNGSPRRRVPGCDGLRSKLIKPITASILLSSTTNGSPFITNSAIFQ